MAQPEVQATRHGLTVAVIGAGAAGLAAAQRLVAAGLSAVVLEARDRIGGRVWTLHPESLAIPVELGPEFLHGSTPELDNVARQAKLRIFDVPGRRFTVARGKLRVMDDFFERLDRVMGRLDESRTPDRSFAEALSRMRGVTPADRQLAVQYVEGFHAAEPALVSERALAEGGSPRDDMRERRIGRVVEGYDHVINALAASVLDRVQLGTTVNRIRWRKRHVEIETREQGSEESRTVEARAAIVTVPLGVLQMAPGAVGGIQFDPPIRDTQRVAAKLVMGGVVRIAVQLDEPFWSDERFGKRAGEDRLDALSFVQSSARVAFPVWWTAYPIRAPLLVGWRGGSGARDMARLDRDGIVFAALDSLATVFGMTRRSVERHVVAMYTHDWINDPFSRGAYSYTGVGGDRASAQLARPVEGTLFFAGEHADKEGRNGTVHGAISSGWDAADRVIEALSRGGGTKARAFRD